jgi:peroxiredoxin
MAPLFTATDLTGQRVDLTAFSGHPILLSFYRSATCRLCNLRLWYLKQQLPHLHAQGLRCIAVFESNILTTRQYAGDLIGAMPVIADPNLSVFTRYFAKRRSLVRTLWTYIKRPGDFATARRLGFIRRSAGNFFQLPADFLLTPELRVATAYYGKDIGDHLPFGTITDFLRQYATSAAPPQPSAGYTA